MQRAPLAAQVLVERGHVRSQLRAGCRGPHEEPEHLVEGLSGDLLGASNVQQLQLKLGQLVWHECDCLKVVVVKPAAPYDAMTKLSFAPADRGAQACKEAHEEACLLHESAFGKHGQEVVHVQPGLARKRC